MCAQHPTRGKRRTQIGEREVIAEVLSDPEQRGFQKFLVRACR